ARDAQSQHVPRGAVGGGGGWGGEWSGGSPTTGQEHQSSNYIQNFYVHQSDPNLQTPHQKRSKESSEMEDAETKWMGIKVHDYIYKSSFGGFVHLEAAVSGHESDRENQKKKEKEKFQRGIKPDIRIQQRSELSFTRPKISAAQP
ncbi:hypothetical protein GW17_00022406, partial [Ensete ventricosum]